MGLYSGTLGRINGLFHELVIFPREIIEEPLLTTLPHQLLEIPEIEIHFSPDAFLDGLR